MTGPDNRPEPADPAQSRYAPAIPQPCAAYDVLGQTLVATLTSATLCAQEATELCFDLESRTGVAGGGARHIVLDLRNVQHMDSACIGMLVELLTKLQQSGGRIAMVNAAHNVEYLFKLTRLDRVFPICRDVMKAIEMVERGG